VARERRGGRGLEHRGVSVEVAHGRVDRRVVTVGGDEERSQALDGRHRQPGVAPDKRLGSHGEQEERRGDHARGAQKILREPLVEQVRARVAELPTE